jgi:hypothetical protein
MIRGKQIIDNTITQSKVNINTSSIINPNNITTKEFVDSFVTTKLTDINYSQLNLNMIALATSGSSEVIWGSTD